MANAFDSVITWFLGAVPSDAASPAYLLYYVARLFIGIIVFDAIFDIFRFVRRLFSNRI